MSVAKAQPCRKSGRSQANYAGVASRRRGDSEDNRNSCSGRGVILEVIVRSEATGTSDQRSQLVTRDRSRAVGVELRMPLDSATFQA